MKIVLVQRRGKLFQAEPRVAVQGYLFSAYLRRQTSACLCPCSCLFQPVKCWLVTVFSTCAFCKSSTWRIYLKNWWNHFLGVIQCHWIHLEIMHALLFRHTVWNITAVSFWINKVLKRFSRQDCCCQFSLRDILKSKLVTSRFHRYIFVKVVYIR